MQNYRTFFVNLNHCKSILSSLEGHLDNETRNKHHDCHNELIKRASEILDKASCLSQQMALVASKWILTDKSMEEEGTWLQVASQRSPDLCAVKSTDYQQFMYLYQVIIRVSSYTRAVSCPRNTFPLIAVVSFGRGPAFGENQPVDQYRSLFATIGTVRRAGVRIRDA